MAVRRVTMQDIADACGLSRNTVSKIFNKRGSVPQATQQMVLKKAQEMGYLQPPAAMRPSQAESRTIVLLTSHMPSDYHFGTFFIPAFADQLSRVGYTLMMCEVSPAELQNGTLPDHVDRERIAGLLTIELFDQEYLDMLCGLNLPVIRVDSYYGSELMPLKCDVISMENVSSMVSITRHVIAAGAKHIGFVGDIRHCSSFHERWQGFCLAMEQAGLPIDSQCCIRDSDGDLYGDLDWLESKFQAMPRLPDAFVCANDFLALKILAALKRRGVRVPEQILVSGFDGTPQSAIVDPSLTTARIPSAEIGRLAADLLLERIHNPDRPLQRIYVQTTPIWRNSTDPGAARQ